MAFASDSGEERILDLSAGYSAKDWKLIIKLSGVTYRKEVPVPLEITLVNVGSRKRLLGEHWGFLDYAVHIYDSSKKEVRLTAEGKRARDFTRVTKIFHRTVPIGIAFQQTFDLRTYFDITRAGRYRVTVQRGLSDVVPPSGGEIPKDEARYEIVESNPVEFVILPQ